MPKAHFAKSKLIAFSRNNQKQSTTTTETAETAETAEPLSSQFLALTSIPLTCSDQARELCPEVLKRHVQTSTTNPILPVLHVVHVVRSPWFVVRVRST